SHLVRPLPWLPILRPPPAEKLLAPTRTSATVSRFGVTSERPPREIEFAFMSSTVKELESTRVPLALTCGVLEPPTVLLVRLRPLTPGCRLSKLNTLRLGTGSSRNSLLSIRPEI